jgi:hypothetical protein
LNSSLKKMKSQLAKEFMFLRLHIDLL